LGRVLLAATPAPDLDRLVGQIEFKKLTPRTTVDSQVLLKELTKVAEQGYAWVDGELDLAICGMAVPVRSPRAK
jgi:IclR family pca regulon transcriptional regulator